MRFLATLLLILPLGALQHGRYLRESHNPAIGNPQSIAAGAKLYATSCAACHAIRGRGSRMGPDLSNIGGSRPLALIRESILEPSKDLSYVGKEGVTVTMKNGAVIQGIARNRSNYSLQVVDAKGGLHLI